MTKSNLWSTLFPIFSEKCAKRDINFVNSTRSQLVMLFSQEFLCTFWDIDFGSVSHPVLPGSQKQGSINGKFC